MLSVLALGYYLKVGALDSDLSRLIEPGPNLTWYQDNEYYKDAFPARQQTAMLVIRSSNADTVREQGRLLTQALGRDATFEQIFAPGIDPFVLDHSLYFLSEQQLEKWIDGAQYNYGALLRLADEASLANGLFTYADTISANPGQPLPITLDHWVKTLLEDTTKVAAFYPLVDPDQDRFVEVVFVSGRRQFAQALPHADLVNALHRLIEEVQLDGVSIVLTGEPALANEEIGAAVSGIEIAATVSLFLLGIILIRGIRSTRIILSIVTMLGMGICMTLGFATLAVGSFNTLSMLFVVMFFGLGIDFAAHFTMSFQAYRRRSQTPGTVMTTAHTLADDLRSTVKQLTPALSLCALTSAISFLAFVPTAYTGLGELGIICAGGMAIALILTLTVIPAMFFLWPPHHEDTAPDLAITPSLARFNWVNRPLKIVALLSLIPAFYQASHAEFDYSVLAMRDPDAPAMRAFLELQRENSATHYSIQVLAQDAAQALHLKSKLSALPSVGGVKIPADLIPAKQQFTASTLQPLASLYADLERIEPSQSDPELLASAIDYLQEQSVGLRGTQLNEVKAVLSRAQALATAPAALAAFEQSSQQQLMSSLAELGALLTAQPFTLEQLPDAFATRLIGPNGQHVLSVQPATPILSRTDADRFIGQVMSVAPNGAGRAIVEWGVGKVVIEAFIQAVTYAGLAIALLLIIYFRSFIMAILVLTPIALTIIYSLALYTTLGLKLNMANILMVPLIIGLGVDTGIDIVHRYRQNQRTDVLDRATQKAVMISGLSTIGTFFSLTFSLHQGAASIGSLLTLSITLLLIISLNLLPALLRRFAPISHPR